MYCVSPNERNTWGSSITQRESYFLKGMNEAFFSTDTPQWDDEIRSILAETIGKTIPAAGDDAAGSDKFAVNNLKRPYDSATPSSETKKFDFQEQPKKMKFND